MWSPSVALAPKKNTRIPTGPLCRDGDCIPNPRCYNSAMFSTVIIVLSILCPANAEMLRVDIDGMTCANCADNVTTALDDLPFLSKTEASIPGGLACSSLDSALDKDAISAAVADGGHTAKTLSTVDNCDTETPRFPQSWSELEGLDVVVNAKGKTVFKDPDVARLPKNTDKRR